MSRPNASAAGLECYEYEWMEEPDLMCRPAVAAGLECYEYEWMEEPDLMCRPAVAAGLESFNWMEEPDLVIPRDDLISQRQTLTAVAAGMESFWIESPDPDILRDDRGPQKQALSDSIWEWIGHTELVFSRGDLGPPLGSSSKSITKFSRMVEDDKPPTILPKPNSEEPNSAGVTSTPLTFTKVEKYPTCGICFKEHGPLCPYFDYVPPGATVGPGYSVLCHGCCHYISMPSWICNNCGGKIRAGKVIIQHCIICKSNYQHESADCPHDKNKAAECRWIREVDRSRIPNYVPRTPIPQELW